MHRRAARSSITLPAQELRLVTSVKMRLGLKSNVEVVRKGLKLLREATDREALWGAYRRAARATKSVTREELDELDHLGDEGLE